MIQRFRSWMRVVLPRTEISLLVILGLLTIDSFNLLLFFLNLPLDPKMATFRLGWLGCMAFAYGVYRAVIFHPLLNDDYRHWLELTPWNVGRPLPAGPIWPVPQDGVLILLLMALNHELTWRTFVIPMAFLLGYLLSNMNFNWATGEWALSAVIAFALATLPLLHAHLEYVLPIELACLGVSYWATQRSLRRFPWSVSLQCQLNKPVKDILQPQQLGWPYDLVAPTRPKVWIAPHNGICISLLLGWLEFTLLTMQSQLPNPPGRSVILFAILPSLFSSLIAVIAATNNFPSPIDLWGRIRTFRWLIPQHDVLPATYFAASLVSILMHATLQIGAGAIGTSLAFLILLVFSPKVEEWRLTAPHRLRFVRNSQEFIQLQ